MIAFPHAKINLGLSVVSQRPDGFHNLETIFYPLPICDVLEMVTSPELRFHATGLSFPGSSADNLILKSYRLLKKNYSKVGPLDIYLHKAIPAGAGLGGGSSDAAESLQLLNRFFELGISAEVLKGYALELGSDCPFFMQSAPCFATGRGEKLEPVYLDLSVYSTLLIHPDIHIQTAVAFSGIQPEAPAHNLKESIRQPISEWKKTVFNVFEIPVFASHPSLRRIKELLYEAGAFYAAMTGSGSTLFGIFEKNYKPDIKIEKASLSYIP